MSKREPLEVRKSQPMPRPRRYTAVPSGLFPLRCSSAALLVRRNLLLPLWHTLPKLCGFTQQEKLNLDPPRPIPLHRPQPFYTAPNFRETLVLKPLFALGWCITQLKMILVPLQCSFGPLRHLTCTTLVG